MRESELRSKASAYLKANFPGLWEKRQGTPQQRAGKWDLMLFWQGCHVEVELKVPGNHLSRAQIQWGLEAERAGALVAVAYNLDELHCIIADAIQGRRDCVWSMWRNSVAPRDREFLARMEQVLHQPISSITTTPHRKPEKPANIQPMTAPFRSGL